VNKSDHRIDKELAVKEADRRWDETTERLKYSVEYAQAGLKGLFLANGAAIVGLLTFVGNAEPVVNPVALRWSFVWFSLGLTCVLAAYLAAYFSQESLKNAAFGRSSQADSDAHGTGRTYNYEPDEVKGTLAVKIGLVLAVGALLLFITGSFVALDAIT
jgi:hypothetical protein